MDLIQQSLRLKETLERTKRQTDVLALHVKQLDASIESFRVKERKAGMQKVVDWISENAPHYQCKECGYEQHLDDDWQAFKKQNGLE